MKRGVLLLVDDDRHVLASMADWLRDQGYELDTATSCAEAVAAVDRKAYDLVLADIRLADGDGFQILQHCRRNRPDTAVIMITGYGTVDSAVEAIRAGAFDFLTKPLIDEELQIAIDRRSTSATSFRRTTISRRSSTCGSAWRTSSATTTACAKSTT